MTTEQGASPEREVEGQEQAGADSSNDNRQDVSAPLSREAMEKRLEKLHVKLPKMIQHLRNEAAPHEMEVALKKLINLFKEINDLEEKLLQDGETYTPLSIPRIFEMAVNGGGGTDSKELEQAYLTTVAERDALLEAVESLTFSMERMKGAAADEILGLDKTRRVPLHELRKALHAATDSIGKIHAGIKLIDDGAGTNGPGQSIDQKILAALGDFENLTSEMLKSAPASATVIGKLTRRFGLAYDYKDIAAARQLVQVALKANSKLGEISESLLPIQEKIGIVHKILDQIEVFAGHEERQSAQYKNAMEEIDRLNAHIQRVKEKEGDVADLEKTIESKLREIELQEAIIAGKAHRVAECQSSLERLQQEIDRKTAEREELESRPDFQQISAKHAQLTIDLKDLQEKYKAVSDNNGKLKAEIQASKTKHQSELAALKNKMRMIEDGLLVEKLENEILKLRELAADNHEAVEKEKQLRIAFEEKVSIWLKDKPVLDAEIRRW